MVVAFGFKAHSGWAALVVVGSQKDDYVIVDRRRVALVEEDWARQPYHAAEGLERGAARDLVTRGIEAAHRIALGEMAAAVKRERERQNEISACAVLTANPMPDWSVEEILSAHFRLHKAEGVLFREALALAATASGLELVAIPEKNLAECAKNELGIPSTRLEVKILALGRTVGPPWGKDQKDSALAAMIALHLLRK